MKYPNITRAVFRDRPNRFIAHVTMEDGALETVHVKNTGRCKELLIFGGTVFLTHSDNPSRKTHYDLVAVEKQRIGLPALLINMDSQIANDAAEEWLKKGTLFSQHARITREVTYGTSRFDFYVEDGCRKAFLEVKGVTLESDGIARFPDAPTKRGVKHLHELAECVSEGYEAYLLFIIQMKGVRKMFPNDVTDPNFAEAFRSAVDAGVQVLALDCQVTPDSIEADDFVEVGMRE